MGGYGIVCYMLILWYGVLAQLFGAGRIYLPTHPPLAPMHPCIQDRTARIQLSTTKIHLVRNTQGNSRPHNGTVRWYNTMVIYDLDPARNFQPRGIYPRGRSKLLVDIAGYISPGSALARSHPIILPRVLEVELCLVWVYLFTYPWPDSRRDAEELQDSNEHMKVNYSGDCSLPVGKKARALQRKNT